MESFRESVSEYFFSNPVRVTLLFALVVFYPIHFVVNVGTNVKLSFGDAIVGVILLGWLLGVFEHRKTPQQIPSLAVFFLSILLSIAVSAYFLFFQQFEHYVSAVESVKFVGAVAWFVGIFVVTRRHAKRLLPPILSLSVLVSLIVATHGLWQVTTGTARAVSTFDNPNLFANYLLLHAFVSIFLISWWERRSLQTFFSASTVLITVGIVASGSRGAIFGGVFGVIVLFAYGWKPVMRRIGTGRSFKRTAVVVIGGISTTLVLSTVFISRYAPAVNNRLETVLEMDLTDRNVEGRFVLWQDAIEAFYLNPATGIGYGQFRVFTPESSSVHNTFLSLLAETGLIGLITFCVFLAVFILHSRQLLSIDRSYAPLLAAFIAIVGQGFVTNVETFRSLWFVAGLLSVYYADLVPTNLKTGSLTKVVERALTIWRR